MWIATIKYWKWVFIAKRKISVKEIHTKIPDFSRQKWVDCVQPVIQIFLIHSLDQKDILFSGDAKGVLDNLLLFS